MLQLQCSLSAAGTIVLCKLAPPPAGGMEIWLRFTDILRTYEGQIILHKSGDLSSPEQEFYEIQMWKHSQAFNPREISVNLLRFSRHTVGLGTHLSKKLPGVDILSSQTEGGLEFPEQRGYCCELQGKQAVKGLS